MSVFCNKKEGFKSLQTGFPLRGVHRKPYYKTGGVFFWRYLTSTPKYRFKWFIQMYHLLSSVSFNF